MGRAVTPITLGAGVRPVQDRHVRGEGDQHSRMAH